jgi:hypothetical protein
MHEATAAMLIPQIATVNERREIYNERYYRIASRLNSVQGVTVPQQLPEVTIVGDSIQFNVAAQVFGTSSEQAESNIDAFLNKCANRGLPVELFGAKSNARNFRNWKYSPQPACGLPATAEIISRAFDVRLPLLFDEEDFDTILTIIEQSLDEVKSESGNKINSELQPQIANVVIPISNSNQTFVDATV